MIPQSLKHFTLKPLFFLDDWLHLWILPLIYKLRTLDVNEIFVKVDNSTLAFLNADLFESNLYKSSANNNSSNKEKLNVFKALKKSFLFNYMLIGIWKLLWALFTWLGAYYFLQLSLDYLQGNKYDDNLGYLFSALMLLSSMFSSICIHLLYAKCSKLSIKLKSALTIAVFRKSLRIFRLKGGIGEVINIVSSDIVRISEAVLNLHFIWSCFVEALLILAISFVVIGYSAFIALGIVILVMPIQIYLGKLTSDLQVKNIKITTKRVHLMSEILTAIKLIKFYAWEKPFTTKIKKIREEEVELVEKTLKLKALNFAIVFAVPVIVALLSLAVYKKTGNNLTSSIAFTILSVFNTLRYPLLMLPLAVKSYSGAKIALERLDDFINLKETEDLITLPLSEENKTAISIKESDFSWEESDQNNNNTEKTNTSKNNINDKFHNEPSDCPSECFLKNINLEIKRGELIAIIGDVGAGKSSLLAAIMGQMNQIKGDRPQIYGSISYVPQEAWILNMVLKDNIVFFKEFDSNLYKKAIEVAALERDLELLTNGDQTEIAERGANLSGGQKQRVSIARAVFNDGDIVLMDDPLSAVDQNVGQQIFNNCIKEQFKNKTVLLVTHQLQYLSKVDRIIVIKHGRIDKMGMYDELMNDTEFAQLINTYVTCDDETEDKEDDDQAKDEEIEQNIELNQFSIQERAQLTSLSESKNIGRRVLSGIIERNQLSVVQNLSNNSHDVASQIQKNQMSVYSNIDNNNLPRLAEEQEKDSKNKKGALISEDNSAKQMGIKDFVLYFKSGTGIYYTVFIVIVFFMVHGIRIGSDFWLKLWVPNTLNTTDGVYLGIYAAFTAAFAVGVFIRGLIFAYETSKKAHNLHDNMFRKVMRAKMAFFDTTPIGRILSAFSKHMFVVDDTLPDTTMQALQYAPLALGAILIVACVVHWPNAVTVVCLVLFASLIVWYTSPAENKLKQLDAITKPSIYAHFTATLEGLFSIRAYNVQNKFDNINVKLIDTNNAAYYALQEVKTFTAFYLDILTSFIVFSTALFIVIYKNNGDPKTVAADAGLALSNALQMLVFLQWTIKAVGDVQAQIASVGQLVYYATQIEEEAPAARLENKPNFEWPSQGEIEFKNVSLKYHRFGVKVLKNVNIKMKGREKIGIVGRTGSGKSTLLISLLRIVELHEGEIYIDNVNISDLGLDDLRTSVAIIPQEPVLFVGTIRYNLDPFDRCTDGEIWSALDSVHLKDKIKQMPMQLETMVIENGKNFSLGQRQLFCIARAILSKAKILVLDEATAAIDMKTDMLIQKCIKHNFANVTVLTIAHRLNTIIEADKVLVMDGGKVMEFDEPINLLENKNSYFKDLVSKTGPASARKLTELAREARKARRSDLKGESQEIEKEPLMEVFKTPSS